MIEFVNGMILNYFFIYQIRYLINWVHVVSKLEMMVFKVAFITLEIIYKTSIFIVFPRQQKDLVIQQVTISSLDLENDLFWKEEVIY